MKRQVPRTIAIRSFAMVLALGVACQAQAQGRQSAVCSLCPRNL